MTDQNFYFTLGDREEYVLSSCQKKGVRLGGQEKEIQLDSSEGEVTEGEDNLDKSSAKIDVQVQDSTIEDFQEEHIIKDGKKIKRTTKLKKTPINVQRVLNKKVEQTLIEPKNKEQIQSKEFHFEDEDDQDESSGQEEIPVQEPVAKEQIKDNSQKEEEKKSQNSEWEDVNTNSKNQDDESEDEQFMMENLDIKVKDQTPKNTALFDLPINEKEKIPMKKNDNKRVSFRRPKENEYVFRDSGEEDNIPEEPQQVFDVQNPLMFKNQPLQEEQNISFISNDDNDMSYLSDDIHKELLRDIKEERDDENLVQSGFDKGSKTEIYLSMGFCFVIFFLSTALWIVLFSSLNLKNRHVYNIVYDVPTLQTYHDKYTEFYQQYDGNDTNLFQTQKMLVKENGGVGETSDQIHNIIALQDTMKDDYETGKVIISNKIKDEQISGNKNGSQRKLGKRVFKKEELKVLKNKIEQMKENLQIMKSLNDHLKSNEKQSVDKMYDTALNKLKELYKDSFSLVEMYGDFYVMTNRIWVTSENIIQLFQKRAGRITKEMDKNHISYHEAVTQNVKLDEITYALPIKINQIPSITLYLEEEAILDCTIEFQIDNKNLIDVENTFDLYLVRQGDDDKLTVQNQSFKYRVENIQDQNSFSQSFKLEKGKQILDVKAQVTQGSVLFKYIHAKCFELNQYPKLAVYEKED